LSTLLLLSQTKPDFAKQFFHTATAEAVAAGAAADSPDKVWDKLWKI
jgi:hypothetical protein